MSEQVEQIARAIFEADCDFGYSIRLTSLVDGVSEYTLTYSDGSEPLKFETHAEASNHTEMERNRARARAVIAALLPANQAGASEVCPKCGGTHYSVDGPNSPCIPPMMMQPPSHRPAGEVCSPSLPANQGGDK